MGRNFGYEFFAGVVVVLMIWFATETASTIHSHIQDQVKVKS